MKMSGNLTERALRRCSIVIEEQFDGERQPWAYLDFATIEHPPAIEI
jgi:hypothetical protein